MTQEINMGDEHGLLTLGDLPESCLSRIMILTTPKEVCKFSVLNRAFKAAGNSDFVWEGMLPPQYPLLLTRLDTPLQFSSKKELYFLLCNPVSIDNGTKLFWLDQATGKSCFMLSARDLAITWGDDNRYWHWITGYDSSFKALPELIAVCWLEVRGQFDCKFLTPGIAYTVSFKLKLIKPNDSLQIPYRNAGRIVPFLHINRSHAYGWDYQPVKFEITTSCGHHQLSARFLKNKEKAVREGLEMTSFRDLGDRWMEFDAGEFVVEVNQDSPMEVKFCMREWEGGNWKGGLLLDGVKIQPSFLVAKGNNIQQE